VEYSKKDEFSSYNKDDLKPIFKSTEIDNSEGSQLSLEAKDLSENDRLLQTKKFKRIEDFDSCNSDESIISCKNNK